MNKSLRFIKMNGGELKVLFIGNSITLHPPKPEIGWHGDWGMAASAAGKDYVHLVAAGLNEKRGVSEYCAAHLSEWERGYYNEGILEKFVRARDFNADLIVVRIGENTDYDKLSKFDFSRAYEKMIDFFNVSGKAEILVTDLFWKSEALDTPIKEVAKKRGYKFVSIGDLGDDDGNKALDLFEHGGVAKHPGDLGMQKIADRILKALI